MNELLRFLLSGYCLVSFVIALSYLHYRRVSPFEYAAWGLLALLLPVFGPFFVIAARPGPRRRLARRGTS